MEKDRTTIIYQMLEDILVCFTSLTHLKEYFNGELIEALYNECHDTEQMVLTCSFKEIINGLYESSNLVFVLELFVGRYISIFKDTFLEQNRTKLCIDFILNLIEQLHKEQNFEAKSDYILEEQPFSVQIKKDYMLNLFLDFFEQTETSGIAKLFFGSNVIVKECQICHSITYKFEIRKTLNFDIDEITIFKKMQNNNNNIDKITLNDCFNYYFYSKKQNYDLICNNENCNGKSNNESRLLSSTSDIMIISLKRNSFEKEEKDIEINTTIDISNYMDKDSLNNLIKFNGKKMRFIYELKAIFYMNTNDYIICLNTRRKNKKWMSFFDGIITEECDDIFEYLDKIKHFQPIILFYEYQESPKSENKIIDNKDKDKIMNQLEEMIVCLQNIYKEKGGKKNNENDNNLNNNGIYKDNNDKNNKIDDNLNNFMKNKMGEIIDILNNNNQDNNKNTQNNVNNNNQDKKVNNNINAQNNKINENKHLNQIHIKIQ